MSKVRVTVTDFEIDGFLASEDELHEAAEQIASDIGMALVALGSSVLGGEVVIEIEGRRGDSEESA